MRTPKTLLLGTLVLLAAACVAEDPTQPDYDQLAVTAEAKPQFVACRPAPLRPNTKGKIQAQDCLFDEAGRKQREDLYEADQLRLGLPDLSGSHMLTFQGTGDFDGLFGVSNWDAGTFGDPVYGYRPFTAGNTGTFSLIGSAERFKLYFSGADSTQLGTYTLTTTVEPSAATCDVGRLVFLEGNVSFSSHIDEGRSCAGEVTVGPNVGTPLRYQYWYAKLKAGQEVTLTLQGVDGSDPTITLAAIVFGSPFALLDFSDGPGDTQRSLTFTAPFQAYYYLEVSALPGVDSPYTFGFQSQ